jgi:hypothetical protein
MTNYRLQEVKSKKIDDTYKKSLKELEEFYGIKLKETPNIMIIKDLDQMKKLRGKNIPEWVTGFYYPWLNSIFTMNEKNFKKHKISKKARYAKLIKHELSHMFIYDLAGKKSPPSWFAEGLAMYTDGGLHWRKKPEKFEKFIEIHKSGNKDVYKEAGFVVELLINKFGKNKILKLLKKQKEVKSKKDFKRVFEQIYKFKINYKNFNNLYREEN